MVLQLSLVAIRAMLEGDTDESRNWREQPDDFWTQETGRNITPRIVLQEFGTECMRDGFDDSIWVSLLKKQMLDSPGDYVIPDVRFRNEQDMIRELGGEIWRVQRGDVPEWYGCAMLDNTTGSNLMESYDVHVSEYKWIDMNNKFNATIYNNSTLEQLKQSVLNEISNLPR
jgi:hypothetical protein